MKILVTGGAGYIGSFMTKRLLDENHEVVVIDSLSRGYKEAIDPRADFFKGVVEDASFLRDLFTHHRFDAVLHFAAVISVGESMQQPALYLKNNVLSTVQLLDTMALFGVKKFIFSKKKTQE